MPSMLEPFAGDAASPRGFRAAGVHCGLKPSALDLALLVSQQRATAAGVFTTNKVQAAPVGYCREIVTAGTAQAIVINSGNANACTGEQGRRDTLEMARTAAQELGLARDQVLVASTGVIGIPLPMAEVLHGISLAARELQDSGQRAAEAILTTDTFVKTCGVRLNLAGHGRPVTVGGMAKGAGMIGPDMATTLCFLTTDARVSAPVLKRVLTQAVDGSFNSITVDGDTSTNDSVLLLANGAAGLPELTSGEALDAFTEGLSWVARELAKMVVRDGEGATRVVAITVQGARDVGEARQAARTVANSPLVKTAIHGAQPNWGRLVCAVGRAGVALDPDRLRVWFNDLQVVEGGVGLSADLTEAARELEAPETELRLDLGVGSDRATVWTCDLTEEYIRINGSYMS